MKVLEKRKRLRARAGAAADGSPKTAQGAEASPFAVTKRAKAEKEKSDGDVSRGDERARADMARQVEAAQSRAHRHPEGCLPVEHRDGNDENASVVDEAKKTFAAKSKKAKTTKRTVTANASSNATGPTVSGDTVMKEAEECTQQ